MTETTSTATTEPADDVDELELCENCTALIGSGELTPRGALEDYPHAVRSVLADSPDAYTLDRADDDHEENPTTRHAAIVAARWPRHTLVLGDELADFSWSQCDGCGSTLGGSRHSGAALGRR